MVLTQIVLQRNQLNPDPGKLNLAIEDAIDALATQDEVDKAKLLAADLEQQVASAINVKRQAEEQVRKRDREVESLQVELKAALAKAGQFHDIWNDFLTNY